MFGIYIQDHLLRAYKTEEEAATSLKNYYVPLWTGQVEDAETSANYWKNLYGVEDWHYEHYMSLCRSYASKIEQAEVRKMAWRDRETYRFSDGDYEHLPWVNDPFWRDNLAIHEDHFAHVSTEEPSMIAFTMTPEHGEQDRQTRMRPGKYLNRFFKDVLTPKKIAFYAEWFARKERPHEMFGGDVLFSESPEQVIDIYDRGPHSCMKDVDAVQIYHGPDLRLAYIEETPGGRVLARALVWPENMVFGRVYPSVDYWSTDGFDSPQQSEAVQLDLFTRLRQMGYTSQDEGGSFEGARLLKIEDQGTYLCPYLDGGYEVDVVDDHLVMTQNGEYDADRTDGYLDEPDEDAWRCESCESRQSGWASRYELAIRWSPLTGPTDVMTVGECCIDSGGTFYCQATDMHYCDGNSSSQEVHTVEAGARFDFNINEYVSTSRVTTQIWNEDYVAEHAYTDDLTGELWSKTVPTVTLHDGRVISEPTFEEAEGWTCSYNNKNYLGEERSSKWPGFPADLDSRPIRLTTREEHAQ